MTVSSASSRDLTRRGSDFSLRASREGHRAVLWLDGEHDIATADVLAGALAKAIATDHADLIVDLSGTQFVGAATIHLLRRSRVLLRRQGRSMTLRFPSKCASRVLALCDLPLLGGPVPHDDGHNLHALLAGRVGKSPSRGNGARCGG